MSGRGTTGIQSLFDSSFSLMPTPKGSSQLLLTSGRILLFQEMNFIGNHRLALPCQSASIQTIRFKDIFRNDDKVDEGIGLLFTKQGQLKNFQKSDAPAPEKSKHGLHLWSACGPSY